MDNESYDVAVGEAARAAIMGKFGSVRGGALAAGIPYVSLDRKLKGNSSFTIAELRRLAVATERSIVDLLPPERAAA